ncbi:transcription factor TGA9-like isoform X3 [Cicer arietinum]|uniref:Transcription factor TGA9-like isoform X3 n=1 Tax=Cicer arietinum TaxID=3827 RepID=A0A1S3EAD1_CICAR|nr:transcription factor TGA9-like isoform X3 [Cicer arietinum]
MASQRIGELDFSEPYGIHHRINNPSSSLINDQGSGFDFGELEEAIGLQGVKIRNDETKASAFFTGKPAATLEMFPSWPMRFHQSSIGGTNNKSGGESSDSALSSKNENPFEPESPLSKKASSFCSSDQLQHLQLQQDMTNNNDVIKTASSPKSAHEKRKGGGSTSDNKPLDAKTLRRLAQNREAARKSRLRKKAYVQQLESSRLKLTQLEQDLQRARSQGMFMDWSGGVGSNISSGAMFDMEYARWLEEDNRLLTELRNGLEAALSDNEMRVMVEGYLCHYDEVFRVKGVTAKADVFHVINGGWTSQAERCFLWIGGFRPSEIIMMLIQQLEAVAEQQIMGMYGLRHSSQQAEEALSQGLDQLQQSVVDTIAGAPLVDGVQQMVVAVGKLANLEGFLRQADNLRQQTLHQLCRLLTVRQAARSFLVIGEYYARLRALSSLWASRSRDQTIITSDENSCQTTTDMQMLQPSHNHFSSF